MNDTFLLFDLDGTISDPIDGIARSLNYALSFFGHEEIPIFDIAQYIGPPLDESFKAITGKNFLSSSARPLKMALYLSNKVKKSD